jgi:hypothetical protein
MMKPSLAEVAMQHEAELRAIAHRVRGLVDAAEQPSDPLEIYARLMRERTISAVDSTLPRTARLIGDERLLAWSLAFLAQRGSRSPYFRTVSGELIRWSLAEGLFASLPAFYKDAARFELACFETNISAPDPCEPEAPLALALPVRFTRASALLECDHGVHIDFEQPTAERVSLLVYRDRKTRRVMHLELTQAAAMVLRRLKNEEPLQHGLQEGLRDACVECNDTTLGELSYLLAALAQRGIVLGAASAAPRLQDNGCA